MNEPNWYEIVMGVLFAGFGWIVKREVARIDALKAKQEEYVTHTDLDERMEQWHRDREDKHQQNVSTLARIEHKIDENEERSSKTRHDIRDRVGTLTTQVAVLEHVMKDKR